MIAPTHRQIKRSIIKLITMKKIIHITEKYITPFILIFGFLYFFFHFITL